MTLLLLLGVWALPMPTFREIQPDAAERRVLLDPLQTVTTNDPRLCVHTRLTDEVEEWKIQETLRMVREMGAPIIVEFFPWAYVEREEGVYDWSHPDRIIKHIENQGIRVIARLGLVPDWVNADNPDAVATLNLLPRDKFPAFAQFVGAFAARYAQKVEYITVWNEPNLNFEWGNRPTDPEGYVELLRQSYLAAKAANPDVIVLNGALSSTNASPGGEGGGWNDLDYLRRMYEAGAADYFDAMAFHNYPFGEPPQAEPAPDRLNFRRMELWQAIMAEYGDADKQIYITETGWNDHPRFRDAVSPTQRINFTLDMYRFTAAQYPTLRAICIWKFRLPAPTNTYPDYFTLVTPDFEPKPIYLALQAYARGEE